MQETFEFGGSECASLAYASARRFEGDLIRYGKPRVGKLKGEKNRQE
jgi:hypothetical protein